MRLSPEQLPARLGQPLLPLWLVGGDEPLLVLESADLVREAARKAGILERIVLHAEAGFDWNLLLEHAGNLSLFGDRKLIDLRLARAPLADGQKALAEWCERAGDDCVLLVTWPGLDWKALKSAWVQALEARGAVVEVRPVTREQLPAWIRQRFARLGVTVAPDAAELLADRVEGNLLAAQQEIQQLALLNGAGALDTATLEAIVADSSRHEVTAPVDAALAGDAVRVLRVLEGLREEGVDAVPVLWQLQQHVRWLYQAAEGMRGSGDARAALERAGAWKNRIALLAPAAARLRLPQLRALLADCAKAERIAKGQAPGSAWDALATLLVRLAGRRAPQGAGREIV